MPFITADGLKNLHILRVKNAESQISVILKKVQYKYIGQHWQLSASIH